MAKNNNEVLSESKNTIQFANEVVSTIAGIAASEVEGIAGMCSVNGGILGKKKDITKGVKVEVGTEEASVDLYIVVEYGKPIQKAAQEAQESVRKAIESMTGLHVVRVDVHVQGVSFEKENSNLTAGTTTAALSDGADDDDRGAFEAESVKAKPEKKEIEDEPAADFVEDTIAAMEARAAAANSEQTDEQ